MLDELLELAPPGATLQLEVKTHADPALARRTTRAICDRLAHHPALLARLLPLGLDVVTSDTPAELRAALAATEAPPLAAGGSPTRPDRRAGASGIFARSTSQRPSRTVSV